MSEGGAEKARRLRTKIATPTFQTAWERIDECRRSGLHDEVPMSMRLLGVSGLGKTFLLQEYSDAFPRRDEGDRTICPIVYCPIPASPTKRGLYRALLKAMGAMPTPGTSDDLRYQLLKLFDSCEVELVLMDEVQHFVDRGRAKSFATAADALKELMDMTRRPFVFAGASRCAVLFEYNTQLRSRVTASYQLMPFHPERDFLEMRGFIRALALALDFPAKTATWLASIEVSERIFYATDGVHRVLRHFLDRLRSTAQAVDLAELNYSCLAEVFAKYIWPQGPVELNPFSNSFAMRRLNEPHEPYCPSPQDGDNHAVTYGPSRILETSR